MTTSALALVDHALIQLGDLTSWVDIKRFRIGAAEDDDKAQLAALIDHRQYRDTYAGGDPEEQAEDARHGPYWRRSITPDRFEAITSQEAQLVIATWALEAAPATAGVHRLLREEVYPQLSGRVYRLPDLRLEAQHDWGWVVGVSGFHEFVIIDRSAEILTLLVASDD